MNKIFFVLFFLHALDSSSQNITIKGICPNKNEKISIYSIDDYFSRNQQLIEETRTDSIGRFLIEFKSSETKKIYIKSEKLISYMFVEPNRTYYLDLLENSYTNFEGENEIEITFLKLDTSDINYKILSFERLLDDALMRIFPLKNISTGDYFRELKEFKEVVNELYINEANSFLKNYIKYSLALNLEEINGLTANSKYDKFLFYIKRDSIDLKDETFTRYFSNFYKDYFYKLKPDKRVELIYQLDVENYDLFLSLLAQDSLIGSQEIAELASMVILEDLHLTRVVSKSTLNYFLEYIETTSKIEENRTVASNLRGRYQYLEEGNTLLELNKHYLNKYRDKYVYLHFFKPDNMKCISELDALNTLYTKYKNYIEFVSIYPTKEAYSDQELIYLEKIKWAVFSIETDDDLWKKLKVKSFPSYILLSENLVIEDLHAKSPSPNGVYETIEKKFFQIKQKIERDF